MMRMFLVSASAFALMSGPALALTDREEFDEHAGQNYSLVEQEGQANNVTVDQTASVWGSASSVFQDGARHYVDVMQADDAGGTGAGHSNYSTIEQEGAENIVLVGQLNTGFDGDAGDANFSAVSQEGHTLLAEINQRGGSSSYVRQFGSFQYAGVDQAGHGVSESSIEQGGWDNGVIVQQLTTGDYAHLSSEVSQSGAGNAVESGQYGDGDADSLIRQNGGAHTAVVYQASAGELESVIFQTDELHQAHVEQSGEQAASFITQEGSRQHALVSQGGSDAATSIVAQAGAANSAIVSQ